MCYYYLHFMDEETKNGAKDSSLTPQDVLKVNETTKLKYNHRYSENFSQKCHPYL